MVTPVPLGLHFVGDPVQGSAAEYVLNSDKPPATATAAADPAASQANVTAAAPAASTAGASGPMPVSNAPTAGGPAQASPLASYNQSAYAYGQGYNPALTGQSSIYGQSR